MTRERPRVVYDCMIFLQGLVNESGVAPKCLELIETGEIDLFVSQSILHEIEDVLTRPELQAKFRHLTEQRVNKLLELLLQKTTFIRNVPHIFELPRDRKDEKYVDLAAEVVADFLVTRDKDLLSLSTDHSDHAKEFRQRFRFVRIIEPVDFIHTIKSLGPIANK